MPINTVKVYYNLALVLYINRLVLKAVIAIFIIFTTINKQLKALLASFILIEVALLGIRSLKVIKQVIKGYFGFFKFKFKSNIYNKGFKDFIKIC